MISNTIFSTSIEKNKYLNLKNLSVFLPWMTQVHINELIFQSFKKL